MLGPELFVYYLMGGIAVGWQWYVFGLPRWKAWLVASGTPVDTAEQIAIRSCLAWPAETMLGPFAFHTTAAAVFGIHLGPWLLSRWYVWIMPLAGMATPISGDNYLKHFELISIVPAFLAGYVLFRHFERLAMWAWVIPTILLLFELVLFSEPPTSVLGPHSSTRFAYFFVIQRRMPSMFLGFSEVDVMRVVKQMFRVAPFYSGVAYSLGAVASAHDLFRKIFPAMRNDETMNAGAELNEHHSDEYEAQPVEQINDSRSSS